MKKSQISMEFMFTIGIVFFIFLIVLFFTFERRTDLRETEDILKLKNECYKISNFISAVYAGGDGTNITTKTTYVISIYNDGRVDVNPKLGQNITFAYYCCHSDECDYLGGELKERFVISEYIDDGCGGDGPNITKLVDEIFQYDFVFLEDPHLNDVNETNLNQFVLDGGAVVISEHIKHDLFGLTLGTQSNGRNPATVVNTDPRYNLELGQGIEFDEKPAIIVADVGNPTFKIIANYTYDSRKGELAGIAIWRYGLGEVSFFSDFNVDNMPNFPEIVADHVEGIISLLPDRDREFGCTYIGKIQAKKATGNISIVNKGGEVFIEKI